MIPSEYVLQVGSPIPATPEVYCVGRFGHGELELSVENIPGPDNGLQARLGEFSGVPGTHELTLGQVCCKLLMVLEISSQQIVKTSFIFPV